MDLFPGTEGVGYLPKKAAHLKPLVRAFALRGRKEKAMFDPGKYGVGGGKSSKSGLTPQTQPIRGRKMEQMDSGGWGFTLPCWDRLERFLIFGSEGGTYYASPALCFQRGMGSLVECLGKDPRRTIETIEGILKAGRAPKRDYALWALAVCASWDGGIQDGLVRTQELRIQNFAPIRSLAFSAALRVIRTSTDLFHFVSYCEEAGHGWGRSMKRFVREWYQKRSLGDLAYQVAKYPQRDGWSHRDLLRLGHVCPRGQEEEEIYKFIVKGWTGPDEVLYVPSEATPLDFLHLVSVLRLGETAENVLLSLIGVVPNLTWEMFAPEQRTKAVWRALIPNMPMMALIRNLGQLTAKGMLENAGVRDTIRRKLLDREVMQKSKVHPMHLFQAMRVYESGRGVRGKLSWTPEPQVVDLLMQAFETSLTTAPRSGKKIVVGLDLSGSMSKQVQGDWLVNCSCAEAGAALAWILARMEPNVHLMGFDTNPVHTLNNDLVRKSSLSGFIRHARAGGGTDCAIPIQYAPIADADAIVLLTDDQTWQGNGHPAEWMKKYRARAGKQTKLVSIAMAMNPQSVCDPRDAEHYSLIGFDSGSVAVLMEILGSGSGTDSEDLED